VSASLAAARSGNCPALDSSAAGHQVNDKNDESNDKQKVNQATGNMKAEAKNPQNQQNHKDRPKHNSSFFCLAGAGEL
jgi:hypothetical protein